MESLPRQDSVRFEEEAESDGAASFEIFRQDVATQLLDGMDREKSREYLNGAAALAVRKLVSPEQRKKDGIFFTSQALAERLVGYLADNLRSGSAAFDPTCGAGDLLLAAAKAMRLDVTAQGALPQLSNRIKGFDLHSSFVESAKLRLQLLAALTHRATNDQTAELFPGLLVSDSLSCDWHLDGTECILLNPPFGQVPAPTATSWGGGRVQRSALFIDKALAEMKPGQHAVAILPDVLRSGTNYSHWRRQVASFAKIHVVEPVGRFDPVTDVDVFLLHLQRNNAQNHWPDLECSADSSESIEDFFTVRTGPLVAYREANKGPWRPYVDCSRATPWSELSKFKNRRFRGTVVSGPFVVLRRTSSPGDSSRTVASIINEENPVAVENHLIILQPKDGRIESCRKLLEYFRTPKPSEWLNTRIRCRHLTVAAVRRIPLEWE